MNVVSFYRFVDIDDPASVRESLLTQCEDEGLLGTILVVINDIFRLSGKRLMLMPMIIGMNSVALKINNSID